jgi:eukaryotic-like serine/threonine-protein kinase
MTLSSGTRLGPYEIVGAIGAGGMGEVYRAHDPRLGRDVAIKMSIAGGMSCVALGARRTVNRCSPCCEAPR